MDQEKHIGYQLHTVDRLVGKRLDQMIETLNITKMQSWIIRYLYERQGQEVYQKDLEAVFQIARSTATGVLQSMEKQGYIARLSVESDARLKRLVLTDKGISLQMAVFEILKQNDLALRQNISEEDLEGFFRVLSYIRSNAEKDPEILHPEV